MGHSALHNTNVYFDLSALVELDSARDVDLLIEVLQRNSIAVWPSSINICEIAKHDDAATRKRQLGLLGRLQRNAGRNLVTLCLPKDVFYKAAEAARSGTNVINLSELRLDAYIGGDDLSEGDRKRAVDFLTEAEDGFLLNHREAREKLQEYVAKGGLSDQENIGTSALEFVTEYWMRPGFLDYFFPELIYGKLLFPKKHQPSDYILRIPPLRLYIEAQGYGVYQRGISSQGFGKRNPGLADLQQITYMAIPELASFISHDQRLVEAGRHLIDGRVEGKRVLSYQEFLNELMCC